MVESDEATEEDPITILKDTYNSGNHRISVRLISEEDRQHIIDQLGGGHFNFAVYDNNKYRMEYEPEKFKAFGSFNDITTCQKLIKLFDEAFEKSTPLVPEANYERNDGGY